MNRYFAIILLVALTAAANAPATAAGQASPLVTDVRAAIKTNDFALGDKLLATYRGSNGVTAEMLEALSWMARGALAAKNLDEADKYARETYALAGAMLKTRPLDQDARLPIAVGAAIEVLGQLEAQRGARSEAVAFLRQEAATFKGTSIEKRIQKNINLLSLEGQPAPALDLTEYLGGKPAAVASLKGKVVLMFFWAHWCSDCKAQAPILAELTAKYRDQGLVLVAPTQRFGYVAGGKSAPADEEMRYIEAVQKEFYPMLSGQSIPVSEANHVRYGVSSTPTLVLVDRAGSIRMYNPGRLAKEPLEARIRALLVTN